MLSLLNIFYNVNVTLLIQLVCIHYDIQYDAKTYVIRNLINMNDSDEQFLPEFHYLIEESVEFYPILHELVQAGQRHKLAYTEAKVLELLIKCNGETVTRESIIGHAWQDRVVTDASLAKSISNLRKVLRRCDLSEECILTVPRIGYKLVAQAQVIDMPNNGPVYPDNYAIHHKIPFLQKLRIVILPTYLHHIIYFAGCFLFAGAFYHVFFDIDNDLSKTFIAPGYEIEIKKNGKNSYRLLKKIESDVFPGAYELFSFAPNDSIVFYRNEKGIVNISYLFGDSPKSYTFTLENFNKAKEVIHESLERK